MLKGLFIANTVENHKVFNQNLTLQLAQAQQRQQQQRSPQEEAAVWEQRWKIWLGSKLETHCLLETPRRFQWCIRLDELNKNIIF